ncbi:unnamed protein product, partial [Effrenium voratum]
MPSFTAREVAGHSSEDSLWVIIDSYVYDVTAFHSMHPGGSQLLLKHGGQDASQPAQMAHGNSRKAKSLMGQYCIGTLAPSTPGSTRKVVALEDMGLPVDPPVTGGTQPRRGLVALDDLGDDDGPEALPTPVPTAARKVVALEDLGEGRSGPVALENLGGPAKQVVPLEELGDSRKVVTLESLGNVDSEAPPPAVKRSMRRRATKETKELTEEKVPQEKTEHEQLIEQLEEDELEDEVKEHVRILLSSWALANKQEQEAVMKTEGEEEDEDDWPLTTMQIEEKKKSRWARMKGGMKVPKMHLASFEGWKRGSGEKKTVEEAGTVEEATEETVQALLGSKVPSTYAEMFEFNATVMGFGKHKWLPEVNRCFDDLVKNSMKLSRLQEECEVLALRICKVVDGEVTLSMYKSAMLAALRSMLPKTWDPTHETAWNWLWDICDANLRQILYKPRVWQPALLNLMSRFTDEEKEAMRDEVYVRFFQAAPQGQDYFKQSNTRLHFIATRAMDMTSELLADPWEMTEQISALGLRHVGYGIPTFLIDPFANCFVEVLSENAPGEDLAIEAFQWSIGVVAKILIRVIQEGSTIVMKAINANSALQLRKAVALAPRSERAQWLLRIQVGTQKISPLSWAIQSGSLEAARAMIQDTRTLLWQPRPLTYYFLGQKVCRDAWLRLHFIGKSRFQVVLKAVLEGKLSAPMDARYIRRAKNTTVSPTWGEVHSYLLQLYQSVAETLPDDARSDSDGEVCAGDDEDAQTPLLQLETPSGQLLETARVLQEKGDKPQCWEERFLPPGSMFDQYKQMLATEPHLSCSFKTFWKIWCQDFPTLKFRKGFRHAVCSVCTKHKMLIKELAHDCRSRQKQRLLYDRHLQSQYEDRKVYWSIRADSRLHKRPIILIADSIDQSKFCWPRHTVAFQSHQFDAVIRPRLHICGLIMHGWLDILTISHADVHSGGSFTIELVSHALTLLQKSGVSLTSRELYLQFDNANDFNVLAE